MALDASTARPVAIFCENTDLRELLAALLAEDGTRCIAWPFTALWDDTIPDLLAQLKVCVVLAEVEPPYQAAVAALLRLHEHGVFAECALILLAAAKDEVEALVRFTDVAAVVQQPFEIEDLLQAVRRAIRGATRTRDRPVPANPAPES